MPRDGSRSKAETSNEEKGLVLSSFRFKLWNWEKFLSQNSKMSPAPPLTNCGNKTFHVESQKTTGLAQIKPEMSPETTEVQTFSPQSRLMVRRKSPVASEASPLPLPQHGRKGTDSPGAEESPRNSLCQPVYECELTSPVPGKKWSPRGTGGKTIVLFSSGACGIEVYAAFATAIEHGCGQPVKL